MSVETNTAQGHLLFRHIALAPHGDCKRCAALLDKVDAADRHMRAQRALMTTLLGGVNDLDREEIIERVERALHSMDSLSLTLLFASS